MKNYLASGKLPDGGKCDLIIKADYHFEAKKLAHTMFCVADGGKVFNVKEEGATYEHEV